MGRLALVFAAAALMAAAPRAAAADELPAGKIGLMSGARQGLGTLGGQYTIGPVFGVEAGWQPTNTDRRLSLGLAWSLVWGYHWPSSPSDNAGSLSTREMSLGGKVRLLTGETSPLYLSLGTGVTLLRTSVPVPPDAERSYVGMYGAVGPELYVLGSYLITFEARLGPFINGPTSLSLAFGISFGSG